MRHRVRATSTQRTTLNRNKSDLFCSQRKGLCFFLSGLLSCFLGSLELTIDGYVRILIEARIGFEARFGLFAAFEDTKIMLQETNPPFECFYRVVALERVSLALGLFDEFAVGHTTRRPVCREMVSVQFVQALTETRWSNDDTFPSLLTLFDKIHRTMKGPEAFNETKIPHTFGVRCGISWERDKCGAIIFQTRNYDIFQMSRHAM